MRNWSEQWNPFHFGKGNAKQIDVWREKLIPHTKSGNTAFFSTKEKHSVWCTSPNNIWKEWGFPQYQKLSRWLASTPSVQEWLSSPTEKKMLGSFPVNLSFFYIYEGSWDVIINEVIVATFLRDNQNFTCIWYPACSGWQYYADMNLSLIIVL